MGQKPITDESKYQSRQTEHGFGPETLSPSLSIYVLNYLSSLFVVYFRVRKI